MNFDELSELVPWVVGNTNHVLTMEPYKNVVLKFPGRHQHDTCPAGGDFVICVTDEDKGWVDHDFTHNDIFADFQDKYDAHPMMSRALMKDYSFVVNGGDPLSRVWENIWWPGTIDANILLAAMQCLALAEHRRYPQFESKGGGRFLPARFAAGITYGLWEADDCKAVQKRGRPGVEWLEKQNGKPPTIKELANA